MNRLPDRIGARQRLVVPLRRARFDAPRFDASVFRTETIEGGKATEGVIGDRASALSLHGSSAVIRSRACLPSSAAAWICLDRIRTDLSAFIRALVAFIRVKLATAQVVRLKHYHRPT